MYILRCSDSSYYTGQTDDLENRMQQHDSGQHGYTATRRPLELVWQGKFETREAALIFEQQIKGWSRAKKEALMAGDWDRVQQLAKGRSTLRQAQPERGLLPERDVSEPDQSGELSFAPVGAADFEPMHELRMRAMRESLERVGRFDPQRSRERLAAGFQPEHMHHICRGSERIGFLTLLPEGEAFNLQHLYVDPDAQGEGAGAWAMAWVQSHGRDVRLSALKQSRANGFYQRHGFIQIGEEEFDIQYRWSAKP